MKIVLYDGIAIRAGRWRRIVYVLRYAVCSTNAPKYTCIYENTHSCWAILIRIESNAISGQNVKRFKAHRGFKLNSQHSPPLSTIISWFFEVVSSLAHSRSLSPFHLLLFLPGIDVFGTLLQSWLSCIRFLVYTDSSIILRAQRLYSASMLSVSMHLISSFATDEITNLKLFGFGWEVYRKSILCLSGKHSKSMQLPFHWHKQEQRHA